MSNQKPLTIKDNILRFVADWNLPIGHAVFILAMIEMAGGDTSVLTTTPEGPDDLELAARFAEIMQRHATELEAGIINWEPHNASLN